MSTVAALRALRDCAFLVYAFGLNVSLVLFVIRAEFCGQRPTVRMGSWGDFAEDVGGFWLDMLAHMFAWPWFAWKAIR